MQVTYVEGLIAHCPALSLRTMMTAYSVYLFAASHSEVIRDPLNMMLCGYWTNKTF